MVVEVQLILMLTVHAFIQPYKKKWHNALDVILFADLALIIALTTYNFNSTFSTTNSKDITISTSFQALLICLPSIYMTGYIIWYILTGNV